MYHFMFWSNICMSTFWVNLENILIKLYIFDGLYVYLYTAYMAWSIAVLLQVHPNSQRMDEDLKTYEFAGKIVGKCLYESARGSTYRQSYRQLVKARFSRSFLAQLIGLRVHYRVCIKCYDLSNFFISHFFIWIIHFCFIKWSCRLYFISPFGSLFFS